MVLPLSRPLFFLGIFFLLFNNVFSHTEGTSFHRCGAHPGINEEAERIFKERLQESGYTKRQSTQNVPVQFHVVMTETGEGSVSDTAINDQMCVLNEAFENSTFVFSHLGTTRTNNNLWASTCDESDMYTTLSIDPERVLNIYLCAQVFDDSILGAAYFPWSSVPPEQSVVLSRSDTVPGGSLVAYSEGDTVVHEVGHWMGLYHVFSESTPPSCTDNDEVTDTPIQLDPTSGCPASSDTCPSQPGLDNIHNFMDYSFDVCLYLFTPGQLDRMDEMIAMFRPNLGEGYSFEEGECGGAAASEDGGNSASSVSSFIL